MEALLGVWTLTEVDVDQSEAAEEKFGESFMDEEEWPKEASRTEYAGGSLELSADGTYATRLPDATWAESSGTSTSRSSSSRTRTTAWTSWC